VFVDHIRISAKAGDGGDGSASFRREKYVPRGGPDGGDGGKGGDVVLAVDPHTDNLRTFFYQPKHRAEDAGHGQQHKKSGKSGRDKILKVPPGTLVYRDAVGLGEEGAGEPPNLEGEGEPENEHDHSSPSGTGRELVADLTRPGERFVLCRGGRGGKGNVHFKSATNQAPTETTPGEPGEHGTFYLELRRIADAGLVGFPNAGKSTLLTRLSAARPKVASYPFTTLKPSVGVVEFPGFSRATVADIPGLIEGAHANVGLGHEFLRHIMRCRLLLFVVDTAGSEGRDPVSDLQVLRREVSLFDEELARKPWLVVANKMDLPEAEANLAALRQRFAKQEVIPVSAAHDSGTGALKERLRELVGRAPE
jgi:GTP-binding protein